MHYTRTGELILAGTRYLKRINNETKGKSIAWLLGYIAHVIADTTIHPVVELKVGPYQGHEKQHRICEMNQDAYIFQRLNLGDIGLSEHLDSGISTCKDGVNQDSLDIDIINLWTEMLREVHPQEFAKNPPNINKWHRGFRFGVDKIAEEGNHLWPLARHVAIDSGITYPGIADIDQQFISDLATPLGKQDYDDIFNAAITNVGNIWKIASEGVIGKGEISLAHIGNWNLDTGRDENNRLVLWRTA